MTRRMRRPRAADGKQRAQARRPRALLLAIGGAAVALALVLLLGFAMRSGGDETAASSSARSGQAGDLSDGERAALVQRGTTLVQPPAKRTSAPEFQVQTASFADGSRFDIHAQRGNIVVIYFMAYWCPTCLPEANALATVQDRYQDAGVRILTLDVDQGSNEQLLSNFRQRAGGGKYFWAIDREFTVARALDVQLLDSTVVVDRQGRIAYRDGSSTPLDTLLAVIETLRAERSR